MHLSSRKDLILPSARISLVQPMTLDSLNGQTPSLPTVSSRRKAESPTPTSMSPSLTEVPEGGEAPACTQEIKPAMREALMQFNLRLLAERKQEAVCEGRFCGDPSSKGCPTAGAHADQPETQTMPLSSKLSPQTVPLNRNSHPKDWSCASEAVPEIPMKETPSPRRKMSLSQSTPQPSTLCVTPIAATGSICGFSSPSSRAAITRNSLSVSKAGPTQRPPTPPFPFAQGSRPQLPSTEQTDQQQQQQQRTTNSLMKDSERKMLTSPALPLLGDTSAPLSMSWPRGSNTKAGNPQIASAKPPARPRTLHLAMPKLPDRDAHGSGIDVQNNNSPTRGAPREVPASSPSSGVLPTSPVRPFVAMKECSPASSRLPGSPSDSLNSSIITVSPRVSQPTGTHLPLEAATAASPSVESRVVIVTNPPPELDSYTDKVSSAEQHSLPATRLNANAHSPLLVMSSPGVRRCKQPNQYSGHSPAAKAEPNVMAPETTPPQPAPGHPTADPRRSGPTSTRISRLQSKKPYASPRRLNPNAGTSTVSNDTERPRSFTECEISAVMAEAAALNPYLMNTELNLSMSTFTNVGTTLSLSATLRVLNLRGSTIPSEGLHGLADIPTLKSVCVSHMRYLTTLVPLVTPTARAAGRQCGIEEIDARFSPLTNEGIWGLEELQQLRRLDVSRTPINDVTCLASSKSLTDLHLTGTRVGSEGLAGLERLPTLGFVRVARTKVTSLKQLAMSSSIHTIIAYSCPITDKGLAGVGEMPRLITLDLSTTKVTNLSLLQRSRSLKTLRAQWLNLENCSYMIQQPRALEEDLASDNPLALPETEASFAGLASIPTLEWLDMSCNNIRLFHSLCESKSLKHLFLRRTRVDNRAINTISRLAGTLETLVITHPTDNLAEKADTVGGELFFYSTGVLNTIGDIHRLQRLTCLDLSFTDVYDLRGLQGHGSLRELIIVETLVTVDGLRGIEEIRTLEVLDISQTSITSLDFLAGGAVALHQIRVRSNRNARGFTLGRINQLKALQHLDISDTVVEDIDKAINPTCQLKELVWRWKERRDSSGLVPALECWVISPRLTGLHGMPCLTLLDLSNSSVDDLAFLEQSTSLITLYLNGCALLSNRAIEALGTLLALETLEMTGNRHISDVRCLCSCRRLRTLRLNHSCVTKAGLCGVIELPELTVLDIANTCADEEVEDEVVNTMMVRHLRLKESSLHDRSTRLNSTAAPTQFRVPRRRRVTFIISDEFEASSHEQVKT